MQKTRLTVGALAALAGAASAGAQSWIAATPGSWNDPANWNGGAVPDSVGAIASIISTVQGGPLVSGGTFSFTAPVTIGSLSVDMGFAGPSVFFNPSTLTFDNGGGADTSIFTDATLNVVITGQIALMGNLVTDWRASNGQISGVISGDYGVIHDTPFQGRIRLYGENTYTGPMVVRNGRVSIRAASGLGGPQSGTVVEAGGTLILESNLNPTVVAEPVEIQDNGRFWMISGDWAGPFMIVNSARFTPWFDDNEGEISGLISGDGVMKRMSAQSRSGDTTRESILTVSNSANSYTGGTVIEGGVLRIFDDNALGLAGTGITFQEDGFNEGSSALLTAADTTIARDITMLDDGWLRAEAGTTGTYTGTIIGTRPLDIGFLDWTGTVALAGDNSYTGGTTVRTGTLLAMNTAGSATGAGTVGVASGATVGGAGTIAGQVVLTGATVAPGASTGTLTVGSLDMDATSTMAIEIGGGSDFDRLVSGGAVVIGGTISATLINGYELQEGDEFEIVSAASVSGAFTTEDLGPNLELVQEATRVMLRAVNVTPPCDADLNGDSIVDGADLGLLLGDWGGSSAADLNGDGTVDGADLGLLLGDWGACP